MVNSTQFVWFNSGEERRRLLTALYEKGYRHDDDFDPMKQVMENRLLEEE